MFYASGWCLRSSKTDGVQGETSPVSRDLKDGEVAEWILLDGVRSSSSSPYISHFNSVDVPDPCNMYQYILTQSIPRPNRSRCTPLRLTQTTLN